VAWELAGNLRKKVGSCHQVGCDGREQTNEISGDSSNVDMIRRSQLWGPSPRVSAAQKAQSRGTSYRVLPAWPLCLFRLSPDCSFRGEGRLDVGGEPTGPASLLLFYAMDADCVANDL
jgi:hypothetical protein